MNTIDKEKDYKPLLSICIPTYNRCGYLKKTIESIIRQRCFLDGFVEVIVSDNASTDDTMKVCKAYDSEYKNFSYIRLEENIRDRNFPFVISKAHGIYRKVFTDTYECIDNKLSEMCKLVDKYKDTRPYICWTISKYIIDRDALKIETCGFREFVLKFGERITNLIYFGLWEDDCINILEDVVSCDMMIWQADKALKVAYEKNEVLIYNNILVNVQNVINKNVTYNIFDIFYNNFLSLVRPYVEKGAISESDYRFIKKKMLFDTFYNWSMKWKDSNLMWRFNGEEDLPLEIQKAYGGERYYPLFTMKLHIAKALRVVKRLVFSFIK